MGVSVLFLSHHKIPVRTDLLAKVFSNQSNIWTLMKNDLDKLEIVLRTLVARKGDNGTTAEEV